LWQQKTRSAFTGAGLSGAAGKTRTFNLLIRSLDKESGYQVVFVLFMKGGCFLLKRFPL